jgi:anti-anti-sigma regulatory factor
MSQLTVHISDSHQIALRGAIDIATVDHLDAVLAGLSGDVELDCTEVEFIGSTGFHSLDLGYGAALARGATFVAFGMNSFQRRIAAMLGVPYVVEERNTA